MSYRPQGLGGKLPTGAVYVYPSAQNTLQNQVGRALWPEMSNAFAWSQVAAIDSPQGKVEVVPARPAYSHSASLGRR